MKFGAFFVTYNRPQILKKTIEASLNQSRPPDLLLIVDNGNSSETELIVREFSNSRLHYVATGGNLGSAGGTAFGVQWLFERDFDWICCGDDDNPPIRIDCFERLLKIALTAEKDVGGVGVVGSLWDWDKGELVRLRDEQLTGNIDVDFIGGNHLLIVRRDVVQSVGTPNGRLFFGYPDLEYCLRIRRAGYRLVVDTDLMKEYRTHFGRMGLNAQRFVLPHRSLNGVWRNYYTTRNYIHMMKTTFQRSDLARKAILKAILKTITSWGRGPKYGLKFTGLQLRSIWDGYCGRLGRTVEPRAKKES